MSQVNVYTYPKLRFALYNITYADKDKVLRPFDCFNNR